MSIDVGVWVSWNDEDEDVPKGTIGEVTEWHSDTRVRIQFPEGNWHFPLDELTIVATPASARGSQGAWRPRQSSYEAWTNILGPGGLAALQKDAGVLEAAGKTEWMWMGASDQPRCSVEAFALEVFKHHTGGDEGVAETGGVEFKIDYRKPADASHAPFTFPHDEPALATMTFLGSAGAPLVVFESRAAEDKGDEAPSFGPQGPPRSYVSYPVAAKHVSFFGDLYHGTPEEMAREHMVSGQASNSEPGVVLLVNIQTAASVCTTERLSEEFAKKMSNHSGLFALDSNDRDKLQQPSWVDKRSGRGERTRLAEQNTSLTAALPFGVMRQAMKTGPAHEFRVKHR